MTRIDFYILEEGTNTAIDKFICRLTEKAWKQNNAVYLHAEDEKDMQKYDELLWTFKETSFVPHQTVANTTPLPEIEHILIGCQTLTEISKIPHEVLINLCLETPSFFSQFERVVEIINQDETSLIKGRERYQFYRDRGYALETHKMSL